MYENGYENVSVLLGGWDAWMKAGYPVEGSGG
jgi:3-mercaptopyruvate sulfurtransferase SseA